MVDICSDDETDEDNGSIELEMVFVLLVSISGTTAVLV